MEAFQNIPASQQAEFMRTMEQMQVQESARMYNSLVHRCFDACANSFKSKTLDAKEKACIEHCSDKFIKLTQRVGFRYSEFQQQAASTQQQQAAGGGGA